MVDTNGNDADTSNRGQKIESRSPDVAKSAASNTTETRQANIGGLGGAEDEIVRRLMGSFWGNAARESISFGTPERAAYRTKEIGGTARGTSSILHDELQVLLQENFYQIIESFSVVKSFNDGRKRLTGRYRGGDAPDTAAPTDAAQGDLPRSSRGSGPEQDRTSSPQIRYSDRELGFSRSPQTYSFDDGMAVLAGAIRENMHDKSRVAEIVVRHLGPMLATAADPASGISKEKLVDGAIALFADLARDADLNRAVIEIVPALRKILGAGLVTELQSQGFQLPAVGEIQTHSALATLASIAANGMSRSLEYEPWTAVYYFENLRMIAAKRAQSGSPDLKSLEHSLETSANNLAASIGRLLQNKDPSAFNASAWERLVGGLVNVSVLMSATVQISSADDIEGIAEIFGVDTKALATMGIESETWASRMSGLHMVSSPAIRKAPLILVSLRYALVGLLRETIGHRKNMASSLFNAGVELLRIDGHQGIVAPLRAIVNALGLLGALRSSEKFVEALGVNDGSDCLVNLFGALVDTARHRKPLLPMAEVEQLVTVVRSFLPYDMLVEPRDRRRIERSIELLQELGVRVSEAAPAGAPDGEMPSNLADRTAAVLNRLCGALGLSADLRPDASIVEFSHLLRAAYVQALPDFGEELDRKGMDEADAARRISDSLNQFNQDMMGGPNDPFELLEDILNTSLLEGEPALVDIGPLVAIDYLDQSKWRELCLKALGVQPQRDIDAAIREAFAEFRSTQRDEEAAPPLTGANAPESSPTEGFLEQLMERAQHDPQAARVLLSLLSPDGPGPAPDG